MENKVMNIIIKVLVLLITGFVLFICGSDLIGFYSCPTDYPIGTEVVDKAGWSCLSNFTFIFFNSIMIILSVLLSFFAIKSKKTKLLLLILLLAVSQIGCLILL